MKQLTVMLALGVVLPLCGCRDAIHLATTAPIVIAGPSQRLEVEVFQNGLPVQRRLRTYHLQAAPFVLRLRGGKAGLLYSYYATADHRATRALDEAGRPIAFFPATAAATRQGNLRLCREPMELADPTVDWLIRARFARRAIEGDQIVQLLKTNVGPRVALGVFGHTYLPFEGPSASPGYHLANYAVQPDGSFVGDYPVETIDGQPVSYPSAVRLVLFADSPLAGEGAAVGFRHAVWETIDLYFDVTPSPQ